MSPKWHPIPHVMPWSKEVYDIGEKGAIWDAHLGSVTPIQVECMQTEQPVSPMEGAGGDRTTKLLFQIVIHL